MDKVGKSFQAEGTACAEAGSMEGPASLVVAVAYGAWVFCAGWHYLNTRGHIFLLQKIIRRIRGVVVVVEEDYISILSLNNFL